MRGLLTSMLIAVLLLAACGKGLQDSGKGYTYISVSQLQQMMQKKDFLLVNTHVPYEGDLPRTDFSIPYDQIGQQLDKLPDRNAKIVLYCRTDTMSTQAALTLVQKGYTHVYELDGGMKAWEQAGLPLQGR